MTQRKMGVAITLGAALVLATPLMVAAADPTVGAAVDRATAESTIDRFWSAANAMDADAMGAVFAEDAIGYEPWGSPPMEGRAAIRAGFEAMMPMFDSIAFTVGDVHVAGDRVAMSWAAEAVAANGAQFAFSGIDVWALDADGQIAELWAYWAPSVMMAAMPAAPQN